MIASEKFIRLSFSILFAGKEFLGEEGEEVKYSHIYARGQIDTLYRKRNG